MATGRETAAGHEKTESELGKTSAVRGSRDESGATQHVARMARAQTHARTPSPRPTPPCMYGWAIAAAVACSPYVSRARARK